MAGIFISAAEPSADLHGSRLAVSLRESCPGLKISAAGSGLLAGAGAEIVCDMTGRAVMGFLEVAGQIGFYRRTLGRVASWVGENRPDAVVLIDAPSYNLRLAKTLRRRHPGLPIFYYIAPKLWAWKEWRVRNLRRDVTRTLCIFPFEEKFFRDRGVDARYVGNPTLDQVREIDGPRAAAKFGAVWPPPDDPSEGILALFPGSRRPEAKYIWPRMAGAAELMRRRFPSMRFAAALAPGWGRGDLARFAPVPGYVELVEGASQELLAASSLVLAKSGTTTLEAALLGRPMAVCYAGHPVSFRIAKMAVRLPHASLPNILLGKSAVRELLQGDATPENLAGELSRLTESPELRRAQRNDFLSLRDSLGGEPSAQRAAREILGCM